MDSQDLPKAYEAKDAESKWYSFWEKENYFTADATSSKPSYCIVIPPPNVTGALHMGHALVNTLQDVLIRWRRMSGDEALWVPGTDHAGISTQTVVEKRLLAQGKRRADLTREEFLSYVWQWKEEYERLIVNQLKKLGASCDWDRQRFTMDAGNNKAVRVIFKKLFDAGLIYRGDYLVNWDPVTQTAIADDEVEYEEKQSYLWHFFYPLSDGSDKICIATTRPETMLGDTAIAVSPKDPRYQNLIGKMVRLPLMDRDIPIIADHHVDPEFGTGMVKITPAHDPNDYQIGLSHHLPFINIMTPDGKINENGGKFAGLTMEEARRAVVQEMKNLGLLDRAEPHINRVGVSYRSKAVIEPYMSKQWFVKMEGFGKTLRSIVTEGKTTFIPKNWENTLFHWIDNLRDWCISRQLWWGHRIPIWYRKDDPSIQICEVENGVPDEVKDNPDAWEQDPDVLDTWFSSALWPFSTLGWPDETADLKKFYPNAVLVTGHDILFFWVARMLLMGEYALKQVPFPKVFLHGLIYGKTYWKNLPDGSISYLSGKEYEMGKPVPEDVHSRWEKMSKTKGNVINPLEMIDEFGADAVRMTLCASATFAREIDLDRRRFDEFRNFANKIWNGSRFVFLNLEGLTSQDLQEGLDETLFSLEDRWILSALNRTIQNVGKHLSAFQFDQAALEAYDFFWKEFCAYYVEMVKPVLFGKAGTPEEKKNKQKLLVIILTQAICLIHPMAPFITEELFQRLKSRFPNLELKDDADLYTQAVVKILLSPACIVAPYPQILRETDYNPAIERTFELVQNVVYTIRNLRGEMKIPPSSAITVIIVGDESTIHFQLMQQYSHIIAALVKVQEIHLKTAEPPLDFASSSMVDSLKVMIPLPTDMLKQEKTRLEKEQEKLAVFITKTKTQLNNEEFIKKAPEELVAKQKMQLEQAQTELHQIENKLAAWK